MGRTASESEIFDFAGATATEAEEAIFRVLPTSLLGKRVLDFACGQGAHLAPFLSRDPAGVTVVDLSAASLEALRLKHKERLGQLEIVCADATTWNAGRQYDVVHIGDSSLQIFDNQQRQMALLHNMRRHVKPDGFALINIVPLSLQSILRFGQGFRVIQEERAAGTTRLTFGRLDVNIYEQIVTYQYRFDLRCEGSLDIVEEVTFPCRLVLKDELLDMVRKSGFSVVGLDRLPLASGSESLYYTCIPVG